MAISELLVDGSSRSYGGIVCVIVFASNDRISLVGSVVAGGLGFCYFVQQQRLSEHVKDLFTEFNARYDRMNDELLEFTKRV